VPDKLCMLFPTRRTARECALFLERYMVKSGHGKDVAVLSVVLHIPDQTVDDHQLHAVIFPPAGWKLAKSCWQHAGMGISSRYAEACLSLLSRDAIMREWTAGVDEVGCLP
jgi:cystathionine gamma-synthase